VTWAQEKKLDRKETPTRKGVLGARSRGFEGCGKEDDWE